jgi:hypothetical protein
LTAASADGCCTKRWLVAIFGVGGGLGGLAEGAAEEVDGAALEAEADVCVDGGGDADVGVPQQLLDHNEFHSLFQEEGRGRVAEVVEPDAAEFGPAEKGVEVPGEGGPFERGTIGASEDVAAVIPARPRRFAFLELSVAVLCEGALARCGQGDAPF